MKITIEQKHIELLQAHHIYTNPAGLYDRGWFKLGDQINCLPNSMIEAYSGHFASGFSNLGAFSHSKTVLPAQIVVGRYCSIGAKVSVLVEPLASNRLSNCGFESTKFAMWSDFKKSESVDIPYSPILSLQEPIAIGNDVWIGNDVSLRKGVRIGDGAVVMSGTVVMHDVAPYTVVAGYPAKVISHRFAKKTAVDLKKSEWWMYKFTEFAGMDIKNPEAFLSKFLAMKNDGVTPVLEENRLDICKLLLEA